MANILPTVVFPGMEYKAAAAAVTANSIVIPISALSGLSAAEADPSTGDGRKVLEAVIRNAVQNITALSAANRPTYLTVSQSNAATAAAPSRYSQTYTVTATVDAEVGSEAELVAES